MTNPESRIPSAYPDLKKIEEVQALPEEAVVRFLSAEGALAGVSGATGLQLRERIMALYPGSKEGTLASS